MPEQSTIIKTKRLILRPFTEGDLQTMYAINQDKEVMHYFPSIQDLETTRHFIDKLMKHFSEHGYSLYATIHQGNDEFIGFVGLFNVGFEANFTPATEIGWRLAANYWNQGLATEAAEAVCEYAFNTLELKELVSFTYEGNTASRRVMEKIGMSHNPEDDFNHPSLPKDNWLSRHSLYRLSCE